MENKLHQFFSESDFDLHEPHSGHLDRFERRLNTSTKSKGISLKWMSIAASVVLVLGFWLGSNHQKSNYDLADVSPKMEEAQNYFVATINQELKEIERHRNLNTEKVIEHALEKLEELEDNYTILVKELSDNGYEKRIVHAMINNYQQRLEILQSVLQQIELINNPKDLDDEENYI